MILEIVSICLSSVVVIIILISFFTSAFRNIGKESRDDYRSVLKELSDIKIDIAKLQTTTDNIKSEISIVRAKQIEIEKEVDSIRKDNDRGLQLNLVESRHAHAHLQLPSVQDKSKK